jgi:hypothetical protein
MKRHRNPPFPIGLAIAGAVGVGAVLYLVTRPRTATQALVGAAAQGDRALSYTGDVIGRALSPAEVAALSANPSLPLTATEVAMLQRTRDAAQASRMYDPQMDPTRLAGGIPIDAAMMAAARANFARVNPQ